MHSRTRRTKIVATTVCATLALVVAPAGAANGAAGPTFAEARSYGVGVEPTSVAAADLDRDGDRDLVVANQESDDVSVLKNGGNGRFEKAGAYPVGVSPSSVVAADVDGDGAPDLAVANPGSEGGVSSTVSVLENRGNGAFGEAAEYEVGLFASSLAAADLDRDGDQDLAVVNGNAGTVSVLDNRGDGSLEETAEYPVESGPAFVTAADLDGDGSPDLVTADGFDTVSVLPNGGDGTFGEARDYAAGRYPLSVAAADLDGDGDRDLAATSSRASGRVSVGPSCGRGSWASFARNTWASRPTAMPKQAKLRSPPRCGPPTRASSPGTLGDDRPEMTRIGDGRPRGTHRSSPFRRGPSPCR